eukprot:g78323.t1
MKTCFITSSCIKTTRYTCCSLLLHLPHCFRHVLKAAAAKAGCGHGETPAHQVKLRSSKDLKHELIEADDRCELSSRTWKKINEVSLTLDDPLL